MLLQQDLLAPRVAQAVQLQGGKHDTETEIIPRPFSGASLVCVSEVESCQVSIRA